MFNTTINDNSKNIGFFNNNLKNEVNITTKKKVFLKLKSRFHHQKK